MEKREELYEDTMKTAIDKWLIDIAAK